jgi:DNA-binding transcriptional regulator YiaG
MAAPRKLTPSQVREIREALELRRKLTHKALAAKYGIAERTVRDVMIRATYAWVP